MNYMDLSIEELHDLLKNNKVTSKDLIKESLIKSHELQDKCNAFALILDDAKETPITDNYLSGIPCLGGEEKIKNSPDNSYEVKLVALKELDKIMIYGIGIDMIKKAYKRYKV